MDGEPVNPVGTGGPVAGPLPGEVLTLAQFDLKGLQLKDTFTVLLPIRWMEPDSEMAFTLSAVELPGVFSLPVPPAVRWTGRTMTITRITWSPIRVYIDAQIEVDPGVPESVCHEILWRWTLEAQLDDAYFAELKGLVSGDFI